MVMEMYILTIDISKLVVMYNLAKYCHWEEFGKEYMESFLTAVCEFISKGLIWWCVMKAE